MLRNSSGSSEPGYLFVLILVSCLATGSPAGNALLAQATERGSRFPDVAAEVDALGFNKRFNTRRARIYGYYPDGDVVRAWKVWLDNHDLPENEKSAKAFEAYVANDFAVADKLFAELTGRAREAPAAPASDTRYPEVAAEIRAFGVKDKRSHYIWPHCDPGPYDASPCEEAVRGWKTWTERHGLPQNSKSAAAFKAYALGDHDNADRHYADLVGHTRDAYDQVAREVRAFGLPLFDGRKETCENNYFSANPCPEAVRLWKAWSAEHGLPLDYRSASTFQAYVEGDDQRGHLQFALAKGHPVPDFYDGPGNRVIALGLRIQGGGEQERCVNNYFAPNPCPKAVRLWKQWAAQEGLDLDYESAAAFQAFANHDFRTGDRLYARAKGLPDPYALAGPGLDVVAYGLPIGQECRLNPFDHEPCDLLKSRRAFEDWAVQNGVPLDYASASAFEAYANYDFERGDRLFAAAKGVSVDQLLREHQGQPPAEDPNKLIIDVYPIN